MPLIDCPECGGKVSTAASVCPHCGYPMEAPQETGTHRIYARDSEFPVRSFREKRDAFVSAVGETETITFRDQLCYVSKAYYTQGDALRIIQNLKSNGIAAEALTDADLLQPKTRDRVVRCPVCGSSQVQMMRKGFSAGKAIAGAALLGPVGLLGGALGSNDIERVCMSCGKRF